MFWKINAPRSFTLSEVDRGEVICPLRLSSPAASFSCLRSCAALVQLTRPNWRVRRIRGEGARATWIEQVERPSDVPADWEFVAFDADEGIDAHWCEPDAEAFNRVLYRCGMVPLPSA